MLVLPLRTSTVAEPLLADCGHTSNYRMRVMRMLSICECLYRNMLSVFSKFYLTWNHLESAWTANKLRLCLNCQGVVLACGSLTSLQNFEMITANKQLTFCAVLVLAHYGSFISRLIAHRILVLCGFLQDCNVLAGLWEKHIVCWQYDYCFLAHNRDVHNINSL